MGQGKVTRWDKHTIKGSCLCGAVSFELSSPPELMNICHCSICRKITGSAYGVYAHVKTQYFRWHSGKESVSEFASSPENHRTFCRHCGSSLPNADGVYVCIPAGSLDDDPTIAPAFQIFAASKAPWHELASSPNAYNEFEPDD